MRALALLLLLVLGNALIYALWTRPVARESVALESRLQVLDDALAHQERETTRWTELERLVEKTESVLEPLSADEGTSFAGLREAFLGAEKGLRLRRRALELRPADRIPVGYRGVRIRVVEEGDYRDLYKFLDRLSGIKAPVAPIESTLSRSGEGESSLQLTTIWLALWPEEQRP
jgi:hypothetical protein